MAEMEVILRDIFALQNVVLTTGREGCIAELELREPSVESHGRWLTLECPGWHIHLDAERVGRVGYHEAPDPHPGPPGRTSRSFRVLDASGEPLFKVFLTGVYDNEGRELPGRTDAYEALKTRHSLPAL